jgi:bifunctional DNA-binding transcriptional regulator/antitoxin component of YhaV-PrlF toxin-antitoxin module
LALLTRITSAKKGTKSLKTTIPEGIAEFLELSDKDQLEWKMQFQDEQRIVLVKKLNTLEEVTKIASKYAKVTGKK